MKRKKGLIIMLCILCILLAVYFALSSWNSRQKEEERAQEESEVIHVTDADAADIVSFSYDMGSGLLSFEKRDGQWYYTEDEDFPLDQSVPEQIAEEIGQITADRELRDGDDLADYGLDEASRITVEAVYTEDEKEKALTLYIGDEDEDGNRYVMINDSRIVYLISDEVCQNILNC